jgi:hypothetical protein
LIDDAPVRRGLSAQYAGVLVEVVEANRTAWEHGITWGWVIVMVD